MSHIKELSYDFARGIILGAGITVGIGAVVVSSIVFAAGPTGGKFGEALNKILATSNWMDPQDGTVKNTLNIMSGSTAINAQDLVKFQSTTGCPVGFAIRTIDKIGNVSCTPIPTAP